MTKSEMVDHVAQDTGMSKKDAETAVDSVLSTIEATLTRGGEVSFTGFGKFHVAQREARQGKHPRTGETIEISASRVPRFSAGAKLKQAVNA
ncbi:MAG: HU family DNA-binding protein [Actinomycetota bacterium]|nr:HU family DNA-binding protein [Actinomycetota bacterium]